MHLVVVGNVTGDTNDRKAEASFWREFSIKSQAAQRLDSSLTKPAALWIRGTRSESPTNVLSP